MLTMSTSARKRVNKSDYHHGNLSNALIEHAVKKIKKEGMAKLNLRNLASTCGVSATAVYRHFQSKNHLLAAIAHEGFEKYIQSIETAQRNETHIPTRLQQIGITYITFAVENPVHFELMYGSFLDKSLFPDLLKEGDQAYQIFYSQFEEATKQGLMNADLEKLTQAAWALVHGAALLLLENRFTRTDGKKADYYQIAHNVTSVLGMGLFRSLCNMESQ